MAHLSEVVLKNFQRHKVLRVPLSPGVTTIVGRTDAGKSAVMRALRWCLLNDTRGGGFVRDGAAGTEVGVRVGRDGLVRTRSKKGNSYQLGSKRFKALDGTVPPEVGELLGVQSVNFQRQIDPPLWFTLSPGQVAKELNRVVDLSLIDATLDRVGGEVRRKTIETNICERRVRELREDVKSLKWVERCKKEANNLYKLDRSCRVFREKRSALAELVELGSRQVRDWKTASGAVAAFREVEGIGRLLFGTRNRIDKLTKLIAKVENLESETIRVPDMAKIAVIRSYGDDVAERRRALEAQVTEITKLEEHLCQAQTELKREERALEREAGNRCPTCGRSPFSSPTFTSATKARRVARRRGASG